MHTHTPAQRTSPPLPHAVAVPRHRPPLTIARNYTHTHPSYTVYAGELDYASPDNGEVGYKVYIGPQQYFVITDIGHGRYQWYAFLAKPVGTAESDILLKVRPQPES